MVPAGRYLSMQRLALVLGGEGLEAVLNVTLAADLEASGRGPLILLSTGHWCEMSGAAGLCTKHSNLDP